MIMPVKCKECKWFRTLTILECSKHCEKCKDFSEFVKVRGDEK